MLRSTTQPGGYLMVMLLIMASGNPALKFLLGDVAMIALFLFSAGLFVARLHTVPGLSACFLLLVCLLLLLQIALFGGLVLNASINFFMQMLSAFMLVAVFPRFLDLFVRCMFLIAVSSLFFYFVFYLPGLESYLTPLTVYSDPTEFSIGVHTFRGLGYDLTRNSGPFWEPGAFAGYLAIALFAMLLLREREPQSRLFAVIMIVALLTTLSTMGYVALVFVAFTFLISLLRGKHPALLLFGFPAVALVIGIFCWQISLRVPFLTDKIVDQIDQVGAYDAGAEINRFGNALYDLSFVNKRPFFGWSANVETRVKEDRNALEFIERQGNALTGELVRFGVIGWLMFMGQWLLSLRKASGSWLVAVAGLGVVSVSLMGEKYMNYPLIMAFFFLERHHVIVKPYLLRMQRHQGLTVLQGLAQLCFKGVCRCARSWRHIIR